MAFFWFGCGNKTKKQTVMRQKVGKTTEKERLDPHFFVRYAQKEPKSKQLLCKLGHFLLYRGNVDG